MSLRLIDEKCEKGITEDSRGISLVDGDFVLCYSPQLKMSFFGNIAFYAPCNRLYMSPVEISMYYHDQYLYMFKLNKSMTMTSMRNYTKILDERVKKWSSMYDRTYTFELHDDEDVWLQSHIHYLSYVSEDLYKRENQTSSIRNMPMRDILGSNIGIGDLVALVGVNKHRLTYGIVISETQVFTETCEKITTHSVFKLFNYTDDETKLYQQLSLEYQKSAKKDVKRALIPGQIYCTNANLYIYLGRCKLDIGYMGESNVLVSTSTLEFYDGVYLKLKNNSSVSSTLMDKANNAMFNGVIRRTLLESLRVEEKKYFLNKDVFSVYYEITNISTDCFVKESEVSSRVKYLVAYTLPKVYTINVDNIHLARNEQYLKNISFKFEFV